MAAITAGIRVHKIDSGFYRLEAAHGTYSVRDAGSDRFTVYSGGRSLGTVAGFREAKRLVAALASPFAR